jgi:hypothetical protein
MGFWNDALLMVDDTFLKWSYVGLLSSAHSIDSCGEMFLVAFTIVDKESNESWAWFLERLNHKFIHFDELRERKKSIDIYLR